jgi:hypothetical protein
VRLASLGVEPTGEAEKRVDRAWRKILDRAGTNVVADTIAGTSAGGLNGTVLATAIARGSDLDRLKEVWLDRASLEADKLSRTGPRRSCGSSQPGARPSPTSSKREMRPSRGCFDCSDECGRASSGIPSRSPDGCCRPREPSPTRGVAG